jgi:hypothetical protein
MLLGTGKLFSENEPLLSAMASGCATSATGLPPA